MGDTKQSVCPLCYVKCSTCSILSTNCLVCAQNRDSSRAPECPCPSGTYENNPITDFCPSNPLNILKLDCTNKCKTCFNATTC
jgi:proprotein convertase subtilisin/kexin type 5